METLPEEILLKIFGYFSWKELKQLSLVNRRWYRVAGTGSIVDGTYLCLSEVKPSRKLRASEDSYIDYQILRDSQRQYGAISCEIFFTGDVLVKCTLLGNLLEVCIKRWTVKTIRITGQYEHLVQFLLRYGHFLANLTELTVVLEQYDDTDAYNVGKGDFEGCFLELRCLRTLKWIERSLPNEPYQKPHSFTFVVPRLQKLYVERIGFNEDNLMLFDCTGLRAVHLNKYSLLGSNLFDSDCSNLKQLTIHDYCFKDRGLIDHVRFLAKLTSLELTNPKPEDLLVITKYAKELQILKLTALGKPFTIDFPMMQQLHELRLESFDLLPIDILVNCPNLRKLTLLHMKCSAPLQLNAPKLDTLIANETVFRFLLLRDCHVIRRLAILRSYKSRDIIIPEFPNVHHLYLKWSPGTSIPKRALGFYTSQVTKLTILNSYVDETLVDLLRDLPNVEFLHLHSAANVPNKIEGDNLKKLLITDSETRYNVLKVPPQLEWLRLFNVRRDPYEVGWFDPLGIPRNCFSLVPAKRFLPLIASFPESIQAGTTSIRHSTLGYRFDANDDEMLNW